MVGKSRSKRKFTLVELLIVIAIIGALAAMLLPALSAARGKAQESNCMSNLRQVQIKINGYQVDWAGVYPPAENVGSWDNGTGWTALISSPDRSLQARKIFNCPSDPARKFSYSFNVAERDVDRGGNMGAFASWKAGQLDKTKRPGAFILVEESDHEHFSSPGTDSDQDNFTQNANGYKPGVSWHRAGVASVYLDGHTGMSRTWNESSMTYSTKGMYDWTQTQTHIWGAD